jgi:short-subunit dehydrogenase
MPIQNLSDERIVILGASRGLGYSLAYQLLDQTSANLWLSSRKIDQLAQGTAFANAPSRVNLVAVDFTNATAIVTILQHLSSYRPTRLFYCAGGGPFGIFQEKPWHSHLWALQLNLLFPAQLLHSLLSERLLLFKNLRQIIIIGSSIAENNADPGASSYSAGKHGLKGLLHSLVVENSASTADNLIDLRLYSPGYMDTTLLPPNSRPRQDGSFIADPNKIADDLLRWALSPSNPVEWHRAL